MAQGQIQNNAEFESLKRDTLMRFENFKAGRCRLTAPGAALEADI